MKLGRGLTHGSLGGVWWWGPSGTLLVGGAQLTLAAWLGSVNSRYGFRISRPQVARDAGRLSFFGAGRDRMRLLNRISLGCRARREEQQRQDQPSHARQTIGADRRLQGEDNPYSPSLAFAPLLRGMHHSCRREPRHVAGATVLAGYTRPGLPLWLLPVHLSSAPPRKPPHPLGLVSKFPTTRGKAGEKTHRDCFRILEKTFFENLI